MQEKNDIPMVPLIQAEKTILHMGHANRRMLTALICVCVTFILTIIIFVVGYTVREENWLRTIIEMQTPAATEVQHGTATE